MSFCSLDIYGVPLCPYVAERKLFYRPYTRKEITRKPSTTTTTNIIACPFGDVRGIYISFLIRTSNTTWNLYTSVQHRGAARIKYGVVVASTEHVYKTFLQMVNGSV
jgi:hypothetical protein